MMTETHPAMLEERIRELEHENARLKHDAYLYKDSYTASMLDLTASAQNLARQEAKTVEYRAAWLAAERTIEALKKRLRGNGGRRVHNHDLDPTCTEYLLGACVAGGE